MLFLLFFSSAPFMIRFVNKQWIQSLSEFQSPESRKRKRNSKTTKWGKIIEKMTRKKRDKRIIECRVFFFIICSEWVLCIIFCLRGNNQKMRGRGMKQRERRLEKAKKSSSSTTKCKAHVKQRRNARGGRQTLRSQLKERETEGAAPHSQSESAHAHKRKGICRRN